MQLSRSLVGPPAGTTCLAIGYNESALLSSLKIFTGGPSMTKQTLFLLSTLYAGLCLPGLAQATVHQPNDVTVPPDGLLVPRDSANGETQVYTYFNANDPQVDWLKDSSPTPDVFSPLCSFTAKLVLRQTGSSLGVGWYNVDPLATAPPAPSEIYTIFPPGATVGTVVAGADIRSDTRYKGGLIGFTLIGASGFQYHYSQSKWNVQCTDRKSCSVDKPWIASVSYLSKNTPNQFYLAFEDGNFSSSTFGNDGDYNDYVYQFTGLTCQGGGQPCKVTGVNGICADGVSQCVVGGGTTCKQLITPEAVEKCDGLDNDCNGKVDDGATCAVGLTCDKGHCVSSCDLEFPCLNGLACDNGRCVDAACVGTTCNAGSTCKAGSCVDPCSGVSCPGGQTCRVGRCIDACAGVTCDKGQACQNGACVPGCDCYPCGDPAKGCSKTSNLCVETACTSVTCDAGKTCKGGTCVDSCAGAVCPSGQICTAGQCVDVPVVAGTDGGTSTEPDMAGFDSGAVAVTSCSCRLSPVGNTHGALAMGTAFGILALSLLRRRRSPNKTLNS